MTRKVDCQRRADHWILLDRTWARRLGVKRTAGMYRIRSRDLALRLAGETLWVDTTGTVHAHGTEPAAASATGERSVHHRCVHHRGHRADNVPAKGSYE